MSLRTGDKTATTHWWAQRATAVLLAFLSPWLMVQLWDGDLQHYNQLMTFLQSPWRIAGLMLTNIAGCFHAFLGMQVIIEDYVHSHRARAICLLLNQLTWIVVFVVAGASLAKLTMTSMILNAGLLR